MPAEFPCGSRLRFQSACGVMTATLHPVAVTREETAVQPGRSSPTLRNVMKGLYELKHEHARIGM